VPGEEVHRVHVRLTTSELVALDRLCALRGWNRSEYVRRVLFRGKAPMFLGGSVRGPAPLSDRLQGEARGWVRCVDVVGCDVDLPKGEFCFKCNEAH
jgi:hypothetical protein